MKVQIVIRAIQAKYPIPLLQAPRPNYLVGVLSKYKERSNHINTKYWQYIWAQEVELTNIRLILLNQLTVLALNISSLC